jgi:hypothetical protein
MTLQQYQLSLLTNGSALPLPALPEPLLLILAQAVGTALGEISSEYSPTDSMIESDLTLAVEAKLNNLREHDQILGSIFRNAVRGRESANFDAKSTELRADLSFNLTNRNGNLPLVAECKIIERTTGRTTALYRDEGVQRFIDGRYSWWSREGFMIAYVRDGSQIGVEIPALFPANAVAWHAGDGVARFRTSHTRTFAYPANTIAHEGPGEIALFHLWCKI